MVCAACKAEVRATNEHIHIERATLEHIVNNRGIILRACGVVERISPRVKPAVPHFHTHFRTVWKQLVVCAEVFLNA